MPLDTAQRLVPGAMPWDDDNDWDHCSYDGPDESSAFGVLIIESNGQSIEQTAAAIKDGLGAEVSIHDLDLGEGGFAATGGNAANTTDVFWSRGKWILIFTGPSTLDSDSAVKVAREMDEALSP